MSKFLKAFSEMASSSSSSSNSKNKEILLFENIDKKLSNWTIPPSSPSNVYKSSGSFIFKTDYVVKTVEDAIPLTEGHKTFQLLSESLIKHHQEKYKFLHIGMIQIGLKPTVRNGLNISALICVRDKRHKPFKDSLLGLVESSLSHGPVHFSCVPNLTLTLTDPNLMNALCLDIKTDGFNMQPNTENLILIYRIHYKVMNTLAIGIKEIPLRLSKEQSTTLFQTDIVGQKAIVPKTIPWDQVKLPENWTLTEATEPIPLPERQLEEIIEHPDGDVEIRLGPSRSVKIHSTVEENRSSISRRSTSSIPLSRISEVRDSISGVRRTTENVFQPQYKVDTPTPSAPSEIGEERPKSPTWSDMGYVSTITKSELKKEAKKLFMADKNLHNRIKFFETFKRETQLILHKKYNSYIADKGIIDFFDWLYQEHQSLLALDETRIKTFLLKTGKVIAGIHPPENHLIIKIAEEEFHASPYKKQGHLDSIAQQSNYTNKFLQSVGEQTTRIENLLLESKSKEATSASSFKKEETEKRFNMKPMSSTKINFNMGQKQEASSSSTSNDEIINEIMKRLKNLSVVKETAVLENPEETTSDTSSENSEELEEINKIEQMFLSEQNPQLGINKTSFQNVKNMVPTKPYYPRPSPVNIQYEEMKNFDAMQFDGQSIIEWNIDGMSEYQINQILQYMTLFATAAKIRGNNSDRAIAEALVSGFTGQLRGWWDFHLDQVARDQILNAVKTEITDDGMTLLIGDSVNTLIFTLAAHFIGTTSLQLDVNYEQLLNLRCPDLSHFKWYKDVFFTKVFERPDSALEIWKEKFLSGLPHLFAERVKNRIKQKHNGDIPYNRYTFGELAAEVTAEGILLCNELKIHNQQRKFSNRKVLGDFCEQIGYAPIKFHKRNKKDIYFPKYRRKIKGYHKEKRKSSKSFNKGKAKENKQKKAIICFKCGKPGHMANRCRVKQKINNLNIDEEVKKALLSVCLNSETESENLELDVINNDDNTSEEEPSSSSIERDSCDGNCDYYKSICKMNGLCVLTKEGNLILEFIDNISDTEMKKQMLQKYLETIKNQEKKTSLTKELEIRNPSTSYNLKNILERVKGKEKEPTLQDLKREVNQLKIEIKELKELKHSFEEINSRVTILESSSLWGNSEKEEEELESEVKLKTLNFVNMIDRVITQKWHTKVTIVVNKEYFFEAQALIDSGADVSCIKEGVVPSRYFEKTTEVLNTADNTPIIIKYKLPNAAVCNNGLCIEIPFVMVKNLSHDVILSNGFLHMLYPIKCIDETGITSNIMGKEIKFPFISPPRYSELQNINHKIKSKERFLFSLSQEVANKQLQDKINSPIIQDKIKNLQKLIEQKICAEVPNAFWARKQHVVSLPYEPSFNEEKIPTKARPIAMSPRHLEICKTEIETLLQKGLIRPSKSPWSCAAFYVENAAELERGVPRLVINYKPLNKVLRWIRYPLPNKLDLIKRLYQARVFSKFDMKSGYWQIQIKEEDRYKTAFTVPFGHYEWNVLPFGLKNAPSEFQKIMNDIFNAYSTFSIVYIDDVLIFSENIDQHFKHLNTFIKVIEKEGLVVSARKVKLFQTDIRFLGFEIKDGSVLPINRAIEFGNKFPDEIKEKTQLQRFLGCVNYVADFYKDLAQDAKPLYERLKKNPPAWSYTHTQAVKIIKQKVKELPCLFIAQPEAFKIVETDASDKGYGGILKQRINNKEQLVRFTSGIWKGPRVNYSTVKKEILSIVLCIQKFESDLINQKFLLKIDCKSAKDILEKDVKNITSKQIFARWQAILSVFDFEIEFIKGDANHLPDFLTREFLQGRKE